MSSRSLHILFIGLFLLFATSLFAQAPKDSLKAGSFHFTKHSLQFSVVDFFRISSFQGATLSYKYHFSDRLALRVGVGLRGSQDNGDFKYERNTDTTSFKYDTERNNTNIDITSQLIYYFSPYKQIKVYAGMGPYFLIGNSSDEKKNFSTDPTTNYSYNLRNYKTTHYEIGVSAVYGLEWFFKKNMSLLAEYSSRLSYIIRSSERTVFKSSASATDIINSDKSKSSGWGIYSAGAKMGLTVYF